jgi:hypothetical protein
MLDEVEFAAVFVFYRDALRLHKKVEEIRGHPRRGSTVRAVPARIRIDRRGSRSKPKDNLASSLVVVWAALRELCKAVADASCEQMYGVRK